MEQRSTIDSDRSKQPLEDVVSNEPGIQIETLLGDITEQNTDAIVNAANTGLRAGGGVCGAIFAKAGPRELQAACDRIGDCPTGEARLTPGYGIPVKGIIHAVGPVYRGGTVGEPELLASAWRNSLELADEHGFHSIAFPSISTGIYGYPLPDAACVVGETLARYVTARRSREGSLELIRIVVRDLETKSIYDRAISAALGN